MTLLQKEMIGSIKGIVYFKNTKGDIYATLNTFSNLYSYMNDLTNDTQDLFIDLAHDTKYDEDVFIYTVTDDLLPDVEQFLAHHFIRTNHYSWVEENEE